MATLNQEQLRRLARLGAMARLEQIREEEAAIRAEFPELFARATAPKGAAPAAARPGRKRPAMTAANRKAVSERMKKYWAERRKGK